VTRGIRTTERDRLSATTINLQREAGVPSITDKAHTRQGDAAEEEEWVRIPDPRWRQVIHKGRERLEGALSNRWLKVNGEHWLTLSALPFERTRKFAHKRIPVRSSQRAAPCSVMHTVATESGRGEPQRGRHREAAWGTDRASNDGGISDGLTHACHECWAPKLFCKSPRNEAEYSRRPVSRHGHKCWLNPRARVVTGRYSIRAKSRTRRLKCVARDVSPLVVERLKLRGELRRFIRIVCCQ
jgi:hypothetical protein